MRGGSQCGDSIFSLISHECGLVCCLCVSGVGSSVASGFPPGGRLHEAIRSINPQSLKPPSGRRSGDLPRLHYQLGVRGSCSGRLVLTPGGLSYGLSSRSLICTQ